MISCFVEVHTLQTNKLITQKCYNNMHTVSDFWDDFLTVLKALIIMFGIFVGTWFIVKRQVHKIWVLIFLWQSLTGVLM